jgi:hypothetical protein
LLSATKAIVVCSDMTSGTELELAMGNPVQVEKIINQA